MATCQKRIVRPPSSSHLLVKFALSLRKHPRINADRAELEKHRDYISALAGVAGADWAISQLETLPPTVQAGWSKAAR